MRHEGADGNWDIHKLDLNGNGAFTDTDELNDDRTHNDVNELTARDIDDSGSDDYTLTYDAVGNLTDDGENYEYVYDAFGRLRKILDTGDQSLIAEYTYNGLGYWIGWHYDADTDDDVDGNDPWYRFVYDTSWRAVATFRGSDSDPKEQFVYHNAGNDGRGGSSYIDRVILRDKDANTDWTSASDGTLEERIYYCQNRHHDVVALSDDAANQVEQVRYSSYGVPFGLPAGDADSDGSVTNTDYGIVTGWITTGYDVRGDMDLDGDVDATDATAVQNASGDTGGRGASTVRANRVGYGGYLTRGSLGLANVRTRDLAEGLGRWMQRDPLGYGDGLNLFAYARTNPLAWTDPNGTLAAPLNPCCWSRVSDHACICSWNGDDDPCRMMQAGGCAGASLGGVICVGGSPVACNWRDPLDCGDPPSPACQSANQWLSDCTILHEEQHFDAIDCSGCPPGQICRLPVSDPAGWEQEECSAYCEELLCLGRGLVECRDRFAEAPECWEPLTAEITGVCTALRACKQQGLQCPLADDLCPQFLGGKW